jgi:YidC/Oxa1 family membrane protein insertase
VIYWVTTNVWTLGQQHFLFRNLPVVGSATVGASAVQAAPGNTSVSGKSSAAGKVGTSGKPAAVGKQDTTGKTGGSGKAGTPAKPAAPKAGANGSTVKGAAESSSLASSARGLLRFGKGKPEPEEVQDIPQAKVVRQQPVRQTRSKRSGKR